jgi:hypothetical protein
MLDLVWSVCILCHSKHHFCYLQYLLAVQDEVLIERYFELYYLSIMDFYVCLVTVLG